MNNNIFNEVQYVKKTFMFYLAAILFVVMILIFGYGMIIQIVFHQQFGTKPMSDLGLLLVSLFSIGISALVFWLVFTSRLDIFINESGIYFRYFPFFRKYRVIHKAEIRNYYSRIYKPIREYGGWGIRFSLKGKGSAYNVIGNKGIQFELNNGSSILIGTQQPEDFINALNLLFRKSS